MYGEANNTCRHEVTQGRKDQKGSWCTRCGWKVYEVEERPCGDCEACKPVVGGHVCKAHHMAVTPGMHVTFKVSIGTCFYPRSNTRI